MLRRGRDVEAGRRLVGDQQPRRGGERHGDHHALAHAAGELVGVLPGAPLGLGNADQRQHLDGAPPRLRLAEAGVDREQPRHLPADGDQRVERGARCLGDHRDLDAADLLQFLLAERREFAAAQHDAARGEASGSADQAQDRCRGHRFARARLAHQPQNLALAHGEARAIDGVYVAVVGGEEHRDVADLDDGSRRRHRTPRMRGSRKSRRLSPIRLKDSTISTMARPGNRNSHHSPVTMYCAPSAVIEPHSLCGG